MRAGVNMDIRKNERTVKSCLKGIEKLEINSKDKKLIRQFHDECYSQGLSHVRVVFYLDKLKQLVSRHYPNKPIHEWDKHDIKEVVSKIERSDYSEWTKMGYKVTIKKFFNWLSGLEWKDKKSSDKVEWINLTIKNNQHRLPEDILTEEEIILLVKNANNIRDKALISVLYESGCRVGELLSLRLKNVEFDEYGAIVRVHGKTGSRRIRLVTSAPNLTTWINIHPFKEERESFLWVNNWFKDNKQRLGYDLTRKVLRECAAKSNIKKAVNPHSFRHSRATHLAKVLTEQQLKIYMGWTQASKMASIYVHLSGKDIDKAILKLHGKIPDDKREDKIKVRVCPICETENSFELEYCNRCHSPLTEKARQELLDEQRRKEKEMLELLDPKRIEEKLNKMVDEKFERLLRKKGAKKIERRRL